MIKAIPQVVEELSSGTQTAGKFATGIDLIGEAAGLTSMSLTNLLVILGGIAAGAAAIALIIKMVDDAVVTYKEAKKIAQDSAKEYEESAAKVASLKSELENVSSQIDAINSKDKIDPTDREALDKLKQTESRLKEQLALEEKLASYRQGVAARNAQNAIDAGGNVGQFGKSEADLMKMGVSNSDIAKAGATFLGENQLSKIDYWDMSMMQGVAAMQNAFNRLTNEKQALEDSYRQYIDNMTEKEKTQNRDRVAEIDGLLDSLATGIETNMTDLNGYLASMTDESGNALKGYEDTVFSIVQLQRQISGVEVDPVEDLTAHLSELRRLAKDEKWDSAELQHYIEVLSGKDLDPTDLQGFEDEWDRLHEKIGNSKFNAFNFLKGDETENLQQFWETVQSIDSDWASFDSKTKEWTINLTSVEELAEKLGLSEDFVNSIIKKTGEAGIDIDTTKVDKFRNAIMDADEAVKTLKSNDKVGDLEVNVDVKTVAEAETELSRVSKILVGLKDEDGKISIDTSEGHAAYSLMSQLYDKMIELSNESDITLNIDTEGIADTQVKNFIENVNNAKVAIQEFQEGQKLKAEGFDIDVGALKKKAKEAVGKVQESFKELPEDKKVKLSITEEGVSTKHLGKTLKVLQQINQADCTVALKIDPALVKGYDPDKESPKTGTVTYKADYTKMKEPPTKKGTVEYTAKYPKTDGKNGRGGFQGNAHASGTWGSDHDGDDLVGERGMEILVDTHTGRWRTIGDNGAEFTPVGKGDIIFNHKQTEQLLKYGHINSRGRALASGNAYDYGIAGKGVLGSPKDKDNDKPDNNTGNHVKTAATNAANSIKDAADSIEKDTKNLVDWVEKVLENIDKKTEKYIAKAEKKAEAGNYSGAAKQYQKALNTYDKSIGKHGDAENLYMRQANGALSKAISSGTITKEMAATIQKRVANGAMDISKLSDGTKAVVDAYKEYYDKAVAAADATMELYDKYEETAKKMYQLPLDQASAKTDKLKNSYELLEKKLEAATSAARKQSLMEQEIANLRQQHAAVSRASETATASYRTAKHRVNETTDRALSGLSDAAKAKVVAKVQQNMVIDVTALTGLTAAGKQAIIDYNASLVAQQDALHNLQMSSLETAASIDELNVSIANLANDKAESKIEKRHKYDDVRDAKYESQSTKGKNRMLNREIDRYQRDYDDRSTALSDTQKKFNKLWNSNRIQNLAEKYGVKEGQKFDLKKLDPKSKDYDKASLYNATVDALGTAKHDERLAHYELVNKKSENLNKIFENNAKAMEANIQSTVKAAEEADKAYNDLDATVVKMVEDHPGMTYDEAMQKVLADTQDKYQKAADAYKNMADTLREWLKNNRDSLNPKAIEGIESTIQGFDEQSETWSTNATNVGTQATDYANQAVVRERDNAQRAYDDIHQKNELKRASGYSVSLEDAEAEEQALTNLIAKNTELINKMKELRDAQTIGSDKWKEYQGVIDDAANQNVSLYGSLDEVKDNIKDIKLKPITKQLQKLDNEQQKVQDHMDYMQNLGMQPMVSDYMKLIQISKQRQTELQNEKAKLLEEQATLDPLSDRYQEIEQEVADIDHQIQQCANDQAGWQKAAQDTVVNLISSVGNAMSSGAGAVSQIANAVKDMIDKILTELENWRKRRINRIYRILAKIDRKISTIQNSMQTKEELGQRVTAADYVEQATLMADKIKTYEKLLPKLRLEYQTQKNYEGMSEDVVGARADPDGSKTRAAYEEWQKAVTTLEELNLEEVKLLNSGLASVMLDPLEQATKYISEINGLLGDMGKLITDEMLFDDAGEKTEQWTRKMTILSGQYRTVQEEISATKNEIWGLSAYLASGQKASESFMADYVDKWKELADAAESSRDLALEIADAMREASEEELNNLQDLIDARREALKSKQDYYDYDKTIRGKTKDIQSIQAQIAALEGLGDAESKAKRARLEAELAAAQEDLDDTIQQHMFDLSDKALDDLSEALEKSHEEQWDKLTSDVDALLQYAAEFSSQYSDSDVSDAIEQILRSYGVITGETSAEDATMISTLFRRTLADVNSGNYNAKEFDTAVGGYNNAVQELKQQGLLTDVATIATTTTELVQAVEDKFDEKEPQTTTNPQGNRSVVDKLRAVLAGGAMTGEMGLDPNLFGELAIFPQGIAIEFMEWTAGTKMEDWFFGGEQERLRKEDELAQTALDILDRLKDVKIGNWRVFGNYATGARRITKNQLAWTQEHGKEEWIVRPSDGAILTPLSPDSGVLPPDITSKLWALAEGKMPTMQMPKMPTPTYDFSETISPVVNIDNSMTVEGSVDAAVIGDLKKFKDEQREDIYQYVSDRMFRGYIHSGGKRRI